MARPAARDISRITVNRMDKVGPENNVKKKTMHFFVANARRRDILVRAALTGSAGISKTQTYQASPQQSRKLAAGGGEIQLEYEKSRDVQAAHSTSTRRAEPEVDDVSGYIRVKPNEYIKLVGAVLTVRDDDDTVIFADFPLPDPYVSYIILPGGNIGTSRRLHPGAKYSDYFTNALTNTCYLNEAILVQTAKSNIAAAQAVAQQVSPALHEHLDTAQAVLQSGGHVEQAAAAVSAAQVDTIDALTAEGQIVADRLTTAAHQLDLARSRRMSARPGTSHTRAVVLEHICCSDCCFDNCPCMYGRNPSPSENL